MSTEFSIFLWNGIFGLSSIFVPWLSGFLLLSIVFLNQTLKHVVKSVSLHGWKLLSTALLMLILVFIFSHIAFFNYNDQETKFPEWFW